MYKIDITYDDFEGNKVTDKCYFNLSQAEVVEIEAKTPGGIQNYLNWCIAENKTGDMFEFIKMLMLKSYGKKSDDGRRFLKSEEIRYNFEMSGAYSEMFMKLISSEDEAAKFLNNIIPQDRAAKPSAIPPKS